MRHLWVVVAVLVGVCAPFLHGCFPISLSPWFEEDDRVFDKGFVGYWAGEEDKSLVKIEKTRVQMWGKEVDGYTFTTVRPKEKSSAPMALVLGKVNDVVYMTYTTSFKKRKGPQLEVPLYSIARVERTHDRLTLVLPNLDYLKELWQKRRIDLDFVCLADGQVSKPKRTDSDACPSGVPLVIESSAVLKDYLSRNSSDTKLFSERVVLKRASGVQWLE